MTFERLLYRWALFDCYIILKLKIHWKNWYLELCIILFSFWSRFICLPISQHVFCKKEEWQAFGPVFRDLSPVCVMRKRYTQQFSCKAYTLESVKLRLLAAIDLYSSKITEFHVSCIAFLHPLKELLCMSFAHYTDWAQISKN